MSFALTLMEGGDNMSTPDLIWNLVMMLLDLIKDSKKEEETNEKDNQYSNIHIIVKNSKDAHPCYF